MQIKKRISLSLSLSSVAILEQIAAEAGATKSEVIEKYLKRKRSKYANTNTKHTTDSNGISETSD